MRSLRDIQDLNLRRDMRVWIRQEFDRGKEYTTDEVNTGLGVFVIN